MSTGFRIVRWFEHCAPRAGMSLILVFCGAAALSAAAPPEPTPAELAKAEQLREDQRLMIELARDRVFPALVNIHVITMNYWGGKEHKGRAVGSGTIVSKEGYVVTNQHVTNNGKKFKCTMADKQEITADLVGEDPLTDLAVLKLNLSELKDPGAPLAVAHFGSSDELEIGDHVLAMGSPFALSRSVTLGIVSNTERVFAGGMAGDDPEEMQLEQGQRTGLFTRWIQHDALINPGNSGGPLVNLKGEIIGINELGGSAMGFAIPSNLAQTVVAALIDHKEVPRSSIGISLKPIEKTGLKNGVLVNSVDSDGPAAKAGMQAGDVILKLGGDALTVRFPEEVPPLLKRIADFPIGASVPLTLDRNGQLIDTQITTEKLQKDRGEESAFRGWGLTALQITDRIMREHRLTSTAGALVSGVRPGGGAQLAEPPLADGDVIKSIDGQPIKDLAAFIKCYDEIMERKPLPKYLLIGFERSGKDQVTLLKPKPDEDEDPPREVSKAWIGIATQPVLKDLAEKLGAPDTLGFRITRVYPGTRASESGLRVGDIVFAVNGDKTAPKGMQDAGLLTRKVQKLDIDSPVTLSILRDGQKQEISVSLERSRLRPEEARRDRNRDFELTVREITFFDRDDNRWDDDVQGVLVDQLEPAGWAGLGGLRVGDLIQKVQGEAITDLDSYREVMKRLTESQPERVVVVVLRGARTHFQYIEPEWKPVVDESKVKEGSKE
ncbi:MAG TPA: PDZ domain-containing protein [Phycisphaerae bacterium]